MNRTVLLGIFAAAGVGLVAVDQLLPKGTGDAASDGAAPVTTAAAPPPVGAPLGADLPALRKRYASIRLARPFETRDFKDRPKRPRPKPRPSREPDRRPSKPAVEMASLRLTAFLSRKTGRVGLLERRGTGKAIYASKGTKLGDVTVAAVGTESLTVSEKGKDRALPLGESLEIPLASLPSFEPLQPEGSRKEERGTSGSTSSSSSKDVPKISETKRMSILERLKARRRKSLQKSKNKAPAGQPAGQGERKPGESSGEPAKGDKK